MAAEMVLEPPLDPQMHAHVEAELARILSSPGFARSQKRGAFLRYVVEETLAGRGRYLKGAAIAMAVFDRDESFDQQSDPVVRLEARRVRQGLDAYYGADGGADTASGLRISIPKGAYLARFELRALAQGAAKPPSAAATDLAAAPPVPSEAAPAPAEATPAPAPTRAPQPPAPSTAAPTASATEAPAPGPILAGMGRRIWPRWVGGFAAALLVLVALLAFLPGSPARSLTDRVAAVAETRPSGPKLAVLPFRALSPDGGRDFLAAGLTEQIRTDLTRFQELWVMALSRQDTPTSLAALRDLGAEYALEGSISEQGGSLRITARLADLTQGRYIWSNSFTVAAQPTQLFEVQDQITSAVIGGVAGKYGAVAQSETRAQATAPDSQDAYDCVLRYYDYQIRVAAAEHAQIKSCLERSVKQAPDYGEAWAVLSNIYLQELRFGFGAPAQPELMAAARHAALQAVSLEPQSALANLMLSNQQFHSGDLAGFRASGTKAIELNPHDSTVLAHFGLRLALSGSWVEGRALMAKARTLTPVHPHWYHFADVFYLYDQGFYAQALTQLGKIDMPHFVWTRMLETAILGQLEQQDAADAALARLLDLQPKAAERLEMMLTSWQLQPSLANGLRVGLSKAGLAVAPPLEG